MHETLRVQRELILNLRRLSPTTANLLVSFSNRVSYKPSHSGRPKGILLYSIEGLFTRRGLPGTFVRVRL